MRVGSIVRAPENEGTGKIPMPDLFQGEQESLLSELGSSWSMPEVRRVLLREQV